MISFNQRRYIRYGASPSPGLDGVGSTPLHLVPYIGSYHSPPQVIFDTWRAADCRPYNTFVTNFRIFNVFIAILCSEKWKKRLSLYGVVPFTPTGYYLWHRHVDKKPTLGYNINTKGATSRSAPRSIMRSNRTLESGGYFSLLFTWKTRAMTATRNIPNWNNSDHVTIPSPPLFSRLGAKRSILPPKKPRGNRLPGCW